MTTALLDRLTASAAPLALGVGALLFLQWPLRDVVGAGATLANDTAQALFAIYVSAAVVHAQRRGGHVVARPDLAAHAGRWRRAGAALCVLPWALFLLWASLPAVWQSIGSLERFPETSNPGYFVIKLALAWMGLLMAWQSAGQLLAARRGRR